MRFGLVIGSIVLLAGFVPAFAQQGQQAQQSRIFRTVTINHGRSISLGEDFSKVSTLFETAGDMFGLKKGVFGGAEKIRVHVASDQKIRAIYFEYAPKKDFQASLTSYKASLGKPSGEENLQLSDVVIRKVSWDDGKTKFQLIERNENGKVSVSSILFDKTGL